MSVAKTFLPAFSKIGEDASEEQIMEVMPELLGAFSTPDLLTVVDKLCATAYVDRGKGTFESLTDDAVAEAIFGADITLQIPVAFTAATVNLEQIVAMIPNMPANEAA